MYSRSAGSTARGVSVMAKSENSAKPEKKRAGKIETLMPRVPEPQRLTRVFLISLLLSAAALVLNQAAVISVTLSSGGGALYTALTLFEALTDTLVFASGIAPILFFHYHRAKKHMAFSFVSAVLYLEANYMISFFLDLISGNVNYFVQTLVYLQINVAARLLIYALILVLSSAFRRRDDTIETAIPFVSKRHRVSGMLGWTFVLRIFPYIVYEIYANITGFIEYGVADMEALDVLSIISAYVEILVDGVFVYIFAYLIFVLCESIAFGGEKSSVTASAAADADTGDEPEN